MTARTDHRQSATARWLWLSAALAALTAASGAELVRHDFGAPADWLTEPWQVREGALTVALRAGTARLVVPGTAALSDYTARVTIRQMAGEPDELRAGLLFRAGNGRDGYFVLLRGDGSYWLGKLVAGKAVPALAGRMAATPTAGPNVLAVRCEGERQVITLNDRRLISRTDAAFPKGGVGLVAEGTGEMAFDDLVVEDLSGPGPATGTGVRTADPPRPAGHEAVVEPPTAVAPNGPPPSPQPRAPVVAPPAPRPTVGGPTPAGTAEAGPEAVATESLEPPGGPASVGPSPAPPPVTARPAVARPAATAPTILFAESFDPPKYRWNEDASRRIEEGEIRVRAVSGYLLSGFPMAFGDFRYRAKARSLSEGGGTYGLVARLQRDGKSGYLFVVRDPDVFAVARLDAGKSVLLRRGRVALPPAANLLEIECVGRTFTFAVNGAVVATFGDDTYRGGGIGLWVDNHRAAAFDDLVVEQAEAIAGTGEATAGEGVPVEPSRVLIEERFDPPRLDWLQNEQRQIVHGALRLTSSPGRFIVSGAPEQRTGDYHVSVDVTRLAGPDRGLCGLVARLQSDSRTGYLLAYDSAGRFVVLRLDDEGATELDHGRAPLRDGTNTLSAHCDGDRLEFELNGTVVAKIKDGTYRTGGFGLYVDNGVMASFDNLMAVALR